MFSPDALSRLEQHVHDRDRQVRLDAFDKSMRGITGNRDDVGLIRFKSLARRVQGDCRIDAVADQVLGSIRYLRILFDNQFDMLLIPSSRSVPHDLVHEIDGRRRPDAAHHPDLELFGLLPRQIGHGIVGVDLVRVDDRYASFLQRSNDHWNFRKPGNDYVCALLEQIATGTGQ